jgi:nucleotide-binding universal stress UspA family protein
MAFKRILLPLDGSAEAEAAIAHASRLARAFNSHLILFQVLDSSTDGRCPDSVDWRMRKAEASRYLHGLAASSAFSGIHTSVELSEGRPADSILRRGEELKADLIVMSAYGASGPSLFPFGGTAHKILALAKISVAVVRQPIPAGSSKVYRRIMVPVDGTQEAEMALQVATAMAREGQIEILVFHAVPSPLMPRRQPLTPEEQALKQKVIDANSRAASHYLVDLERRFGGTVKLKTRMDVSTDTVRCIHDVAREEAVDLLVMTSHDGVDSQAWSRETIGQSILALSRLPIMLLHSNPD